jgi:hypothetical protein
VNGLTVVDVGASRITGSGTVRNLHNVADFSGNYVSIAAGATVAGGGSVGNRHQCLLRVDNARRHDDELQMRHGLGRQCCPQRRRAQRHAGECDGAVFRRASTAEVVALLGQARNTP